MANADGPRQQVDSCAHLYPPIHIIHAKFVYLMHDNSLPRHSQLNRYLVS